jgi:hypothetical protein
MNSNIVLEIKVGLAAKELEDPPMLLVYCSVAVNPETRSRACEKRLSLTGEELFPVEWPC